MDKLKEIGTNSEKQVEEARLTASELLNVEAGTDTDKDEDWCLLFECFSKAECYTGV
jgi:hypothetical protein